MGTVTKFWRRVEVTKTDAIEPDQIVVQQVSLDVLSEQVKRAYNVKVYCEAELHKAERHLQRCQQALVNRMVEVAKENGIVEIRARELPE